MADDVSRKIKHNENHPRIREVNRIMGSVDEYYRDQWMIFDDILILATVGYDGAPNLTVQYVDDFIESSGCRVWAEEEEEDGGEASAV